MTDINYFEHPVSFATHIAAWGLLPTGIVLSVIGLAGVYFAIRPTDAHRRPRRWVVLHATVLAAGTAMVMLSINAAALATAILGAHGYEKLNTVEIIVALLTAAFFAASTLQGFIARRKAAVHKYFDRMAFTGAL